MFQVLYSETNKERCAGNNRSYCIPQKVASKSFYAINKHFARRQICINQSGTQHSAARYAQANWLMTKNDNTLIFRH